MASESKVTMNFNGPVYGVAGNVEGDQIVNAPQPPQPEDPTGNPPAGSPHQLSPARQRILQAELDRRYEKLGQLRLSRASEAGTAIDFQLQKQIEVEEAAIAKLEAELGGLGTGGDEPGQSPASANVYNDFRGANIGNLANQVQGDQQTR